MNKRQLFLVFPYEGKPVSGYSIINCHRFMNDEPPYIMVTYWGRGLYYGTVYEEDGEHVSHYLMRTSDVDRFIQIKKDYQNEVCDYHLEGVYTRNAGEHNLTPKQYVDGANIRKPKVKFMAEAPWPIK